MCSECGCFGEWAEDLIDRADDEGCFPSELPDDSGYFDDCEDDD